MSPSTVAIGFLVCLLGLFGCGDKSQVRRAAVEGSVTFDNEPVEQGVILFVPDVGVVGPPVQVMITKGKYTAPAATGPTVGRNSVQITANRKTGKERLVQGVQAEEVVQFIPDKYNTETTLQATIVPGENSIDFDLQD